jgi:nitrite reductase/ring-hydroxylating ferredoxin subunit
LNTINKNNKIFIRAAKSSEVKENQGYLYIFEDLNEVAIFRVNGQLHCLSNICPHQHIPKIYNGFVKDNTITCPMHGWTFSLDDGQNLSEGKSLEIYEVFEEKDYIYVEKKSIKKPNWKL